MKRAGRVVTGFLLLLFFSGCLALLAPMSFGRVLLDLDGTQVRGQVTGKFLARHWDRWRGRMANGHLTVAFRTLAGEPRIAELSVGRETFGKTLTGQAVTITYWAPLPVLSALEPAPWGDTAFLLLLALALALLFLWLMTVLRIFHPPSNEGPGP